MITLQQVLLLEEKVESAVAKIAQLNAENAALRSKCAELTNALAAKTEQFSSFQNDQNKIEEGILKALNRLDVVENEVLKNGIPASSGQSFQINNPSEESISSEIPVSEENQFFPAVSLPVQENSFETMTPVIQESVEPEVSEEKAESQEVSAEIPDVAEKAPESQQNSLFDIF